MCKLCQRSLACLLILWEPELTSVILLVYYSNNNAIFYKLPIDLVPNNFSYKFGSLSLHATGLPSPPWTPSYTVKQYGQDSVTLTVQWQPPQYDAGAPINYTITVSPGLSPVTTSGTSVPVTVPYNVIHTVNIVATNCNGSSSAAMVTIPDISKSF